MYAQTLLSLCVRIISVLQAALTCPGTFIAASISDEAVAVQNACLPSISGPLPSNTVYMGVPPTVKQWTLPSGLKDHTALRLSYGMYLCYEVVWLLGAVVMSLLPVAALVAAIYALPAHSAQSLAASTGACNSPAYTEAYHITPFKLGQVVAQTAAFCDAQTDHCSISSFLSEMSRRGYEQADPAKSIGVIHQTILPCRADNCAHFDDDVPDVLPRCLTNASRTEWCPEVLVLLRNVSVAGVRASSPCVMDVLVDCNQQAIVAALNWVPTGSLMPPLTCARRGARELLTLYSWREPLETLQGCARLMLARFVFYISFILTAFILKRLLVGRFQSGVWEFWDLRSNEWIRQFAGYILGAVREGENTWGKTLNGSQWRVVLYRFFGMRVGKRVFLDRDVATMGAL